MRCSTPYPAEVRRGSRAIVVMTDGRDENDPGPDREVVTLCRRFLPSFARLMQRFMRLVWERTSERNVLETFAQHSGGEAFFPTVVEELGADYARVVEHLRRRYVAT